MSDGFCATMLLPGAVQVGVADQVALAACSRAVFWGFLCSGP